ncbi:hypothetical protein BU23DRAFT_433258, partial [Bimuria novae-zelandiae CBS 107.79]
LLCSSSKFFQAATKDEWDALRPGDQKQTVTVEFEPDLFKSYVHWLYSGTIPRPDNDEPSFDYYEYLARLYVMGEEIMDISFKNVLLENFAAMTLRGSNNGTHRYPGRTTICIIYQGTIKESPLRRMVVGMYSALARENWHFQGLPEEAMVDILRAMAQRRP